MSPFWILFELTMMKVVVITNVPSIFWRLHGKGWREQKEILQKLTEQILQKRH